MSDGAESQAASQYIFGKLSADSRITSIVGTRIYEEQAPQDAAYPLIVFRFMNDGSDKLVSGAERLWTNFLFLVEGIDQTSSFSGNLNLLSQYIYNDLHGTYGTVSSGTIHACTREEVFKLAETNSAGVQYRRLGGRYRLLVT